jgi:hypothetical protein
VTENEREARLEPQVGDRPSETGGFQEPDPTMVPGALAAIVSVASGIAYFATSHGVAGHLAFLWRTVVQVAEKAGLSG